MMLRDKIPVWLCTQLICLRFIYQYYQWVTRSKFQQPSCMGRLDDLRRLFLTILGGLGTFRRRRLGAGHFGAGTIWRQNFFFQIRFSVATFFGLQLALLVLGLRTLVGTGSRSTAFKYFFEDEKNRISLSSLIAFSISINTFENLENFLKYEFFFLNLRTWKSFVEFKHSGCLIVGTPHI